MTNSPDTPGRRRFSVSERVAFYLASNGRCAQCGTALQPGWHGDHVTPYSAGGPTDATNGQALCPTCNLKKGSQMSNWNGPALRGWQRECLDSYIAKDGTDFLAVATPGAGKTTFALRLAFELLEAGTVQRVVVVVPTEHLKVQWANAAHRCGIDIDPTTKNANGLEVATDYRGAVLTYAQVSTQPDLHRMGCRRPTLVILDEIHHAGDERAWGDAVRHAFGAAARRLSLSGTPFRSDSNPIPFVTYGADGKSVADYTYGYGRAIRDEVCRQVDFHFYDGEMRWMDSGTVTSSANLSAELVNGDASAVLDTALDPGTGWMRGVLEVADRTLTDLRDEAPNAGGLVIAYRGRHARAYAQMLKEITGEEPTVVLSEDGPAANAAIERFADSGGRWLVAVRMVSEGVDVPRLAVGVYATKTKTEMFFRQAVGRFVRRRAGEEHAAVVFAPALPGLRIMAAQIEQEIQHEIDREREEAEEGVMREGGEGQLSLIPHVPIGASAPVFDRAIHAGQEYTAEENAKAEVLLRKHGFPASALASLRKLVREDLASEQPVTVPQPVADAVTPTYKVKKQLKTQLSSAARRLALSTGVEHKAVQWEINQFMGVSARDKATVEQLRKGLEYVARRLSDRP
ncbi:DEAD/DEAH box helicase family protein [Streptomyces sp. 184]|uniref:DEAD/DEAH box helicase family protein n=1 Tax=Streptomyces sp. 184 TaxID=1827526 RepID=UPI00389234FB